MSGAVAAVYINSVLDSGTLSIFGGLGNHSQIQCLPAIARLVSQWGIEWMDISMSHPSTTGNIL